MATTIWLGNHEAVDHIPDPDGKVDERGEPVRVRTPLDGKRCTRVEAVTTGAELAGDLTRLWAHLSDAAAPAWVATHDQEAMRVMAWLWPDVEVREPQPEA